MGDRRERENGEKCCGGGRQEDDVRAWDEVRRGGEEGTRTRPDYLVNHADKKIEGPFGEKICTEIEK